MKRGRKRKQGVKRTSGGRISRASDVQMENVEPIRLRMKRWGLSEKNARDQKAASVHGVMLLRQKITDGQYYAGEKMFTARKAYMKAIKAPDALANTQGSGLAPQDTESYVDWVLGAVERFEGAKSRIRVMQEYHRGRNLFAAMDYMLFRNEYYPHMEADFSVVLHGLSIHFGLTAIGKSSESEDEILRSYKCA